MFSKGISSRLMFAPRVTPCAPAKPKSPLATAPSFEEITHMPGMTAAALAFWLTTQSHPTMPNLVLSPQQVRNVSAYVLSLRD